MKKFTAKIKPLTPIWTGNVEGKSEKLRETSIIGSLRGWFEAIVRGFGSYACDSLGEVVRKCELEVEKYKKNANPEELICPVCYVFGTTGWSRRFRLEVDKNSYRSVTLSLATGGLRCNYSVLSRNVKWWLGQTLRGANPRVITERTNKGVFLNVTASGPIIADIVYLTLKTIQELGALGSHNSYGFGIVKVLEPSNININMALSFIEQYCKKWRCDEETRSELSKLPNLKHAFKIDFRLLGELHNKNIGFILKYAMRNKFKNKKEYGKDFAEQLFGSKKDRPKKFSGRVFVSNCWEERENYFFRVYGILPPVILGSRKKEDIIGTIEECISECLDAEVVSRTSLSLGEDEYLSTTLFKKLVMKNE